jgi:hypothetical protein
MKKNLLVVMNLIAFVGCTKEKATYNDFTFDFSLLVKTWSMHSVYKDKQMIYLPNANKNYEYWKIFYGGKMIIQRSIPSQDIEIDTVLYAVISDKFKFGYELDNSDRGDSVQIVKLTTDTFRVKSYTNAVITFVQHNL